MSKTPSIATHASKVLFFHSQEWVDIYAMPFLVIEASVRCKYDWHWASKESQEEFHGLRLGMSPQSSCARPVSLESAPKLIYELCAV